MLLLEFCLSIKYPLYKQCDQRWGNDTMGVPGHPDQDDSICSQGCAMSCVAMALGGHGIKILGQEATPGTLNKWLQASNGYQCLDGDCCNLVLDAPTLLAPSKMKCYGEPIVPFYNTLVKFFMDGLAILAHVRNRHHFVLIIGIDKENPQSFITNDPGFNQTSYRYSEIHDVILYDFIQ